MKLSNLKKLIVNSLKEIYSLPESESIAEWLIMDVFNIKERYLLYENLNNEINESSIEYKRINNKLKKLLKCEPIQYVTHKSFFYGTEFFVNKYVLIPRPETEEMCYEIIKTFSQDINLSAIDIGTGSGCIAITLKKFFPQWDVYATDVSTDALKVALYNAKRHNVLINFFQDDLLNTKIVLSGLKFNLIVSNPPYIPENEKNKLHKNVVEYEPSIALFVPNDNPLVFYKAILEFSDKCLNDKGYIFVETHESFAYDVENLFKLKNYKTSCYCDIRNKPRFIKAIKP